MNPDTFQAELTARLGPRYRLRRAVTAPRWCIEQKVDRVHDYPANDDRAIRLRDGYHLVLDTPDTDTTTCPKCFSRIALPVFQRAEFYCEACLAKGVKVRMVDGYYPLVERTLRHLEQTSPRRGRAWADEIEAKNKALRDALDRDTRNLAEDLALDNWNRISETLVFGRTKAGTPHRYGRDD